MKLLKQIQQCAFAVSLMLACGLAWAGQPINVDAAIEAKLKAGKVVDVLVWLDDSAEQAEITKEEAHLPKLSKRKGKDYEDSIFRREQKLDPIRKSLKQDVGGQDMEYLEEYGALPFIHIKIKSLKALERLQANPKVKSIRENKHYDLQLNESLKFIGQPTVKTAGFGGAGATVCVLDTYSRADYVHPAFGTCGTSGSPGPGCKVAEFVDYGDGTVDADHHGTNVGGIVLGVAPDARIVPINIFKTDPVTGYQTKHSDILLGIKWCTDHKAQYNIVAINMSFGDHSENTFPVSSTLDYPMGIAMAIDSGITVVAGAGNDTYKNGISLPAAYEGVVSVGAVYDSNIGTMIGLGPPPCTDTTTEANQVTCFSNSASFLTMLAPGAKITAAGITISGTSQASPHVAGAVAVIKSANPGFTVSDVIASLQQGPLVKDKRANNRTTPMLDLTRFFSPTISAFTVSPSSNTASQPFTISYTVSDRGGSGLNRVVLRRTSGDGSASDPGWQDIKSNTVSGVGPVSGSFTDIPPSVGTYWYGVAAFDNLGNSKDERQAGLGPQQATVTATPTYTVTTSAGSNGSIDPVMQTVTQGNATSFTITPDTGYMALASGCGGNLVGSIYTTGLITADCTVSVTFTLPVLAKVTPMAWSKPGGPDGAIIRQLAISPNYAADQTAFAITVPDSAQSTSGSLFKSSNGGVSWNLITSVSVSQVVTSIVLSPNYAIDQTLFISSAGGGVLRSTDGGTIWSTVNAGLPIGIDAVDPVAISPNYAVDHTVFVGTYSSGIFKSTDGGETWGATNTGLPNSGKGFYLISITVSPNYVNDQTIILTSAAGNVASQKYGAYKSNDGGKTWAPYLNLPFGYGVGFFVFSQDFSNDQTLFAFSGASLYKSIDGGVSWNPTNAGLPNGLIKSVAVSPNYATDSTLYVGMNAVHIDWATAQGVGVFKSNDGGATWNAVNTGLTNLEVNSVALSPNYSVDQTLFAGTYDSAGVFKSIDAGASWSVANTGLAGLLVNSVALSPNYPVDHTIFGFSLPFVAKYYGSLSSPGSLFKSTDGGVTWDSVRTGITRVSLTGLYDLGSVALSPNYAEDQTILATLYGKSTDGGISWNPACAQASYAFSPNYKQDQNFFCSYAGGGGVFSSISGALLTLQHVGFSIAFSPRYAVDQTVFVQTNFGLLKSTDGGGTWTAVNNGAISVQYSPLAISPGYLSDQTIFSGTISGIYKSADGGLTWVLLDTGLSYLPGISSLAISPDFVNDQTIFASGQFVGVLKSTNGGANWSPANTGLTGAVIIRSLAISPGYPCDGTLFAGTHGSSVWKYSDTEAMATCTTVISLSTNTLSFAGQTVGSTSAAQTVTLSNTGNAVLSITSIVASGDYARTTTCGSTLAAGTSCTISVTFTPTATGTRTGAITITSDAAGSPHGVSLSGTGTSSGVDLAPTALSTSTTSVNIGASLVVNNTVANQGTTATTATSTVSYYLSTDATITSADSLIGSRTIWSLAAGASNTASQTITIPTGFTPGVYYLGMRMDSANSQAESDETNNAMVAAGTVTVVRDVDLVPTALSTTSTSVNIGTSLTIDNTVANQGTTVTSASSSVSYYLSADATITTADSLIGSRMVGSLVAGASNTASQTITIPASFAPGVYYLGMRADAYNAQPENNETNNTLVATGTVTVVRDVDLVMSAVSTAATSVNIGGSFTIDNTETNQGSTLMSTGTNTVRFYLSTDATITSADTLLTGSRNVTTLAAGASSIGATTVTVPTFVAPGTYYVGAIADANGVQPETVETNNGLAGGTITVVRDVDLVMSVVSTAATSVNIGGSFTIADTETNQGSTLMSVGTNTVRFYLSTDATITSADTQLTGSRNVTTLAAGASSAASTTVTVPTYVAPGTYYVGAIADANGVQPETVETNNGLAGGTLTVVRDVDLVMSVVSTAATSVNIGGSFTIDNTETNQGSTLMSTSTNTVRFYLSTDAIITSADTLLTGSRNVTTLAAGASSIGATTVTVPTFVAPGTYYVGAIADANGVQPESNETNNGLAGGTITVVRDVDLVMSAVSTAAASVNIGGSFTIADTETNQGSTLMSVGTNTVRFYLSADPTITSADTQLTGSRNVTTLAAGASSAATTTVTVPTFVAPGTYYIGALADANGVQPETVETNNGLAGGTITIVRDVDLVMSAVSTTAASVNIGGSFTIDNTETNQGSTLMSASTNTVRFYLSSDPTITSADTQLTGSRNVTTLAAGASSNGATTVTVPTFVAPGTYYLGAIADANGVQPETVETNNGLAGGTITIVRDVDMVMSAVSTTAASVNIGGSFTIADTETNQGSTLMSASTNTVRFYLSSDPTITSADTQLTGSRNVTTLAAGASSNGATTVTVPTFVAPGTYYIGALADANGVQPESVETNNAFTGNQIVVH